MFQFAQRGRTRHEYLSSFVKEILLARALGPAFIASIAYTDPGNFAINERAREIVIAMTRDTRAKRVAEVAGPAATLSLVDELADAAERDHQPLSRRSTNTWAAAWRARLSASLALPSISASSSRQGRLSSST
ncbi:MAG: hypothetical protein LC797_22510 [Chloroflexi bacterium]|nr:hypothetical protein [Chloroflexota bacterium]